MLLCCYYSHIIPGIIDASLFFPPAELRGRSRGGSGRRYRHCSQHYTSWWAKWLYIMHIVYIIYSDCVHEANCRVKKPNRCCYCLRGCEKWVYWNNCPCMVLISYSLHVCTALKAIKCKSNRISLWLSCLVSLLYSASQISKAYLGKVQALILSPLFPA